MKSLLALLIVLIFLGVLVAGYVGVVPGLSPLMARQVDLGVKPDPKQVNEILAQLGQEHVVSTEESEGADEPKYEGLIELKGSYTDQQVTSALDYWSNNWKIVPIYNIQIKFGAGGQAEASGILKVKEAMSMAKSLGYSDEQISKAAKYVSFINGDLPVYVVGSASVSNNQVSVNAKSLKIGNVIIPESIANQVVAVAGDMVEKRMSGVSGLDVVSMDHANGTLNIEGSAPQLFKSE